MATLYILYGSATGNAEYIAKDLAAKGPPAPFAKVVCDAMEKFKKYSDVWSEPPSFGNSKHGIVVVCSTTGNGDPPENASRFLRYVKRKTTVEQKAFQHCCFAALGLGDTNYDIFCGAAKAIDKGLAEAGGQRVQPLACADEATGLEDVVEPWTERILGDISKACYSKENSAAGVSISSATTSEATKEPPVGGEKKEDKESEAVTTPPPPPPADAIQKPKILDKTLKSESPLFILYGSATGNAEQIAKDLAETYNTYLNNPDVYTYFPSVVCMALNSWRKECLPIWEQTPASGAKHGLIVLTSTTGNADAPENAERFVRWLTRKPTIAAMPFSNVAYAVLGLGDTNYDVFAAIGKAVDKSLEILGGTRAKPLVCADEATGLEDMVDPWLSSIFMDISVACQKPCASAPEQPAATKKAANQDIPSLSPEEEKKIDGDDADTLTPVAKTLSAPMSTGARTVCSVLGLDWNSPLGEVDKTCLPKIGSSLCACQILSPLEAEQQRQQAAKVKEDDTVSVSSEDDDLLYTLKKPCYSSIVNARYLTNTSTDAARKAADFMSSLWMEPSTESGKTKVHVSCNNNNNNNNSSLVQQSMDIYSDQFPLVVNDTTSQDTAERNAKRVIELTLALPEDGTFKYTPGDSVGLVVENLPEAVEFVLAMLQASQDIRPDQCISIDKGCPMTVREALQREVDLCSPLKNKRILCGLSQYASDPEDRKALELLSSKSKVGQEAFDKFVDQQRLSVVDLLKEFPSCQGIPLTALLGMLPGIPPRYYSISSSPLVNQRERSLTVSFSVVDYVTPSLPSADKEECGLRRKKGVATSYLEALASPLLAGGKTAMSACLKIFPKPTADFRMPTRLSTPMILIGPGTGIGMLPCQILAVLCRFFTSPCLSTCLSPFVTNCSSIHGIFTASQCSALYIERNDDRKRRCLLWLPTRRP